MKDYVIEDYTGITRDEKKKPTIQVVDEDELWDILQSSKNKPRALCVFEVGKCLLDWS